MTTPNNSIDARENEADYYCKVCGGCGVIGCCGIKSFLKNHVVGKTNCPNEAWFINDLLGMLDIEDDITGVVTIKELNKEQTDE